MQHLNAREWLESQRLEGCEWAPELLDLLDAQDGLEAHASAIEGIAYKINKIEKREAVSDREPEAVERWTCSRLDLLDSLETIIDEASASMTWPNGKAIVDADDKLQAMLDSGRWLEHDL